MAAHRYWRLYVYTSADIYIYLAELEMFEVSGGTNVCTGGTSSQSSAYDANWTAAKAFDGIKNLDAGWHTANIGMGTAAWVAYDFGSGNEKDIVEFAITSGQTQPTFSPKDFALQYSDDGIWWAGTETVTGQIAWGVNETRTFSFSSAQATFVDSGHISKINAPIVSSDYIFNPASLFNGDAEISGTISIEASPVQNAVVRLIDSETGTFIRQTLSNISGHYEFLNVKRFGLYDVIAEDPDQLWEKKVSSRRVPFHRSLIKSKQFAGQSARFSITTAIPYRYFKLNISANGSGDSYINLGAIRLTGEGYDNLCQQYGGTWSQSSAYSVAYEADQAFLEVPGGMWHTASESVPFHAQWDFGSGNAHGVDVLGITYAGCCNRYPYDFTFEGSNDGSTWTTLGTWTGQTGYTLNVMKFFSL